MRDEEKIIILLKYGTFRAALNKWFENPESFDEDCRAIMRKNWKIMTKEVIKKFEQELDEEK